MIQTDTPPFLLIQMRTAPTMRGFWGMAIARFVGNMGPVNKAYRLFKILRGIPIRIGLPFSWAMWIAKKVFLR